jgi:hypothetical protein
MRAAQLRAPAASTHAPRCCLGVRAARAARAAGAQAAAASSWRIGEPTPLS